MRIGRPENLIVTFRYVIGDKHAAKKTKTNSSLGTERSLVFDTIKLRRNYSMIGAVEASMSSNKNKGHDNRAFEPDQDYVNR